MHTSHLDSQLPTDKRNKRRASLWNALQIINLQLHGGSSLSLCVSYSVVSNSLRPHGLYPASLLCPWSFPGKSTGVGCHFLLWGIFPSQGSNSVLLHCSQILYHVSHQWSSASPLEISKLICLKTNQPSKTAFLWVCFSCPKDSIFLRGKKKENK